jgi:hypothetical protein
MMSVIPQTSARLAIIAAVGLLIISVIATVFVARSNLILIE